MCCPTKKNFLYGLRMSQDFVHLRMHTHYSVKDAIINPKQIVHRAVASGMKALAITDMGVLFGGVVFYKAARSCGIKPILGADIWIQNDYNREDPFRMLLLCQNSEGYLQLCNLLTKAWLQNQYKEKGEIEFSWLTPESTSGLILLSGFDHGPVGKALLHKKKKEALEEAKKLEKIFSNRFYLELQRAGRPHDETLVQETVNLAKELDIPVVATHPIEFEQTEDFMAHEIRVAVAQNMTINNPNRPRTYTKEQYFKSKEEMIDLFSDIPSALDNSVEIAKRCNVILKLGKPQLPIYPTPDGMSLNDYMAQLARQGLERRMKILYPDETLRKEKFPTYSARLEREIDIIQKMDFPGYFLIVQDFINWAKTHGCPVGPGRGSGAGSLVAYCLGITDLDPLAYNLLFERFLNPERISMPDFDVDFCQNNRQRVIEYVKSKYGDESVSQIATFGTMGARGVVKDVGRALDYSYGETDRLSRMIPNKQGMNFSVHEALEKVPEFRDEVRNNPRYRTLIEYALQLEGTIRSIGIHAGGVLIAPGKLIDFCPLYAADMLPENVISMFDKKDVEDVGLVKFDFLGLTTLTIIERCLDFIEANTGKRPDIEHIVPNDPEVFKKVFQEGDTCGVFQFESPGMRKLLRNAHPTKFEDLIALNALYRPGPMDLIDDYLAIKDGKKAAEYADERLKPVLEETGGIMVYQEQVMLVAQIIGGYSLGGADILRRAMGKKDKAEMERQSKVFIEGAAKNGVSEKVATELFELMKKFAGYGFNKSHAAAYSYVAYKTAWLRHYYPAEFIAANLCEVMDNSEKMLDFIRDAKRLGVTVLGPDINKSDFYFTCPDSKTIRTGLGAVKGSGLGACEAIMQIRQEGPYKDIFDLTKRVGASNFNRKLLEALSMAGVFDSLDPNRRMWYENSQKALQIAQEKEHSRDQMGLFGEEAEESVENLLTPAKPWSVRNKLDREHSVLGFYLSEHPTESYRREFDGYGAVGVDRIESQMNSTKLFGMYKGLDVRTSQDGNPFALLNIEANDVDLPIKVSTERLNEIKELCSEIPLGEMVLVQVNKSAKEVGLIRMQVVDVSPLYKLRSKNGAKVVIRPTKDFDPHELKKLLNDSKLNHKDYRMRVMVEFNKFNARARLNLPDIYSVAADWKVLCEIENSAQIDDVKITYSGS